MRLQKTISFALMALIIGSSAMAKKKNDVTLRAGRQLFDTNWRFTKGEGKDTEKVQFDDAQWDVVEVPHDWSIEGPVSKDNPSFSRGAWMPTGKCAYRKYFTVPADLKDKRFEIQFDGAYRNSEVYINGHLLGKRPLGYIPFNYDMTKYIKVGEKNVLTVKLDNSSQPGSRWYSGTGIYRDVHVSVSDKLYIPTWQNYLSSNEYDTKSGTICAQTQVCNEHDAKRDVTVLYEAYDADNKLIATKKATVSVKAGKTQTVKTKIYVPQPNVWAPNNPYLYTVKTSLVVDGKSVYAENTKLGIRSMEYSHENGFVFNGKSLKLKGACLHHAGGPLGAAIERRTIERQLEKLRSMGCNAVRTAHNPFSQTFFNVCDSMGFFVMSEMFDEWQIVKKPATRQDGKLIRIPVDYYAKLFDEWADRDMTDFVLSQRNHTSICMWSIGNEIDQMRKEEGAAIAFRLGQIVNKNDYRPFTNGVNGYGWGKWPNEFAISTSQILGYNYITEDGFVKERELHPNRMAVVTEHSSTQQYLPRGVYLLDSQVEDYWKRFNYKYTNTRESQEKRGLGEDGMAAWEAVRKRPYMMGMFIWTGFDYLGEVTPYGWPARSSSFAPIDLCGFPKVGYYFYQSQWTKKPMVHVHPGTWNFEGHEGEPVKVTCYTNCDAVELYLNGKKVGKQVNNKKKVEYQQWVVKYEPGVLEAKAYKKGKVVATDKVETSGKSYAIKAVADAQTMKADAHDLIYVECDILDKQGRFVPNANDMIKVSVSGPAKIAGMGNGNPFCHELFQDAEHSAFNGKVLLILKSTRKAGNIRVKLSGKGLKSANLKLRAVK